MPAVTVYELEYVVAVSPLGDIPMMTVSVGAVDASDDGGALGAGGVVGAGGVDGAAGGAGGVDEPLLPLCSPRSDTLALWKTRSEGLTPNSDSEYSS